MSDNKKYYYLKLKDDFFNQEEIKLIESQPNGIIYSNIYLKLCLLSLKNKGELRYKQFIPYDEAMLSTLCNVDIDHIRCALVVFLKMELIDKLDDGTIFILEIQSLIGKSSSEAERKADYRERIKSKKEEIEIIATGNGTLSQKSQDSLTTMTPITKTLEFRNKNKERERESILGDIRNPLENNIDNPIPSTFITNTHKFNTNNAKIYSEIRDAWNSITGQQIYEIPYTALCCIRNAIAKGVTPDQFKAVIQNKYDEWRNDPKMRSQIMLHVILNGSRFDCYLNACKTTKLESIEDRLKRIREQDNGTF